MADEAPAESPPPAGGEAPAEAPPADAAPEGAPAEQPPEGASAEGAPGEGAPGEGAPAEGAPAEGTPAEGAPGEGAPAEGAPGEGAPGEGAPAEGAPEEGAKKASVAEGAEGAPAESKPSLTREKSSATKAGEGSRRGSLAEKRASGSRASQASVSKAERKYSTLSAELMGREMSVDKGKPEGKGKKGEPGPGYKRALGSITSIRRASGDMGYGGGQRAAKFMNSYKLESDKAFHVEKVEAILKDVLIEALENLAYEHDKVAKQAKWATSAIRAKVKEQEYDRYKIICLVTIGEKRCQDMYVSLKFLWDQERDKFAFFTHDNMHVYGTACCFGFYYE